MPKNTFTNVWKRITGIHKDCQGFVVMSTLAIFLFLFILCASIYAVGETIHQRIKIQNACDAAAYSAAVIQADGLSRMATVNRAMAWSYVQMTNRQMDYITYRWLKLTCKRFQEDKDNARAYAEQLILAVDKELGWWAILEAAATGIINVIADKNCDSGGHAKEQEGLSWWCGLEYGTAHEIDVNQKNSLGNTFAGVADELATNYIQNKVFTYDNLTSILNVLTFIDKNENSSNAEDWGYYLGKLIDYDKKNIYRMNQSLERINTQMEISMKMTAENVLKAMLKDNRMDSDTVLKDYYISIHIPHAENPYINKDSANTEPQTYFSALHNTEADEMLFLNMQNPNMSSKSLLQHFPVFPEQNLGSGLDQWFIRGCGNYDDQKDHCYDAVPMDIKLAGTYRNEGALGIQRVYKDTNLNEGRVGFLSKTTKEVKTKNWTDSYVGIKNRYSSIRRNFINNLPKCCYNAHIDTGIRVIIGGHYHETTETVVQDAKVVISRGNHLFSLMDFLNAGFDAAKSFIGGGGTGDEAELAADEEDEDGDISVENADELAKSMKDLQEKNTQLQREISELREKAATATPEDKARIDSEIQKKEDEIAANNKTIAELQTGQEQLTTNSGKDNTSASSNASGEKNDVGDIFSNIVSSVVDSLVGDFLDVDPSCDNIHADYAKIPMCTKANATTALYSEYRWASCKYYCLTKLWTWSICVAFGKDIYCDRNKKTIKKIGFVRLRGRGHGHYGWPKWFCGASPTCSAEGVADWLLKYFPPAYGDISGDHGYMDGVWDLGKDGFLQPIIPLLEQKNVSVMRDEYESCAMFPDGTFRFATGANSYAGLIRGHARIYADDKEIFDNRYVGAVCKPWVLNERFFAGEGTIVVGAAMKHTNPFVQLFNFWNTKKDNKKGTYAVGTETQKISEKTVLSAFNIPEGNYMWTMSAARAGVRHHRRNGAYDQERQYQITYDSTSDAENLSYNSGPCIKKQGGDGWTSSTEGWDHEGNNQYALSRINFPGQKEAPVWNGCPCNKSINPTKFKNMWNLCETDWDATLLPLRYALQTADLYLSKGSGSSTVEGLKLNDQNYDERIGLIEIAYDYSEQEADGDPHKVNDSIIGNGGNWMWRQTTMNNATLTNAVILFQKNGWKKADQPFWKDLFKNLIPEEMQQVFRLQGQDNLNLYNKIPEGKEMPEVNPFTLLNQKVL